MNNNQQIVFFLDRSLGKHIVANTLRNVGENVEIHDDHFCQDTLDKDWLQIVAKRGWIILTADQKIAYRYLEKLAVMSYQAKLFVLVYGNISGKEMAHIFITAIQSIKTTILNTPAPFIAKVYKYGQVKTWKNHYSN